jgi:molybdopterin synthase catalytic subunit
MFKVQLLFFATLKDRVGCAALKIELPPDTTLAALKTRLATEFPALAPALPTALAAINHEFAFADDIVREGDEVAFFPPVSGGGGMMAEFPTIFRIANDPIDLNALTAAITLPSTGAVCVFTGMVRGMTARENRVTTRLEYEAYAPMAEAKMRQVAEEIRARWASVEGLAIVQRIGPLDPGTPTVLIACSAAHRDTGVFEAARYGIDRLKEIVPVWKKEVGPNGEVWVEGHYVPTAEDKT